jgi:transcriptional regulator with XRE-family HTH domain
MLRRTPMNPIYLDFGRRLRTARREAELTQEALAKRVGLSRTSITNIEQGNQHVGLHLLYELAKAVGVRAVDLLPDEQAVRDNGPSLDDVLVGMRRSDRAKVQRDMQRLTEDDRERVLRLVREETVRHADREQG